MQAENREWRTFMAVRQPSERHPVVMNRTNFTSTRALLRGLRAWYPHLQFKSIAYHDWVACVEIKSTPKKEDE